MEKNIEYYGIHFLRIAPENIDHFIKNVLGISADSVLHSHFYTDERGDFCYSDELDLMTYCKVSQNTATIDTEYLYFHKRYDRVLCMIYPDIQSIDVECCGIADSDFPQAEIAGLENWLQNLQDAAIVENTEIFYDDEW